MSRQHSHPGARVLAAALFASAVVLLLVVPTAGAAPPANDDFDSAQPIAGESGLITGGNVEATSQSGEPEHGGPSGVSVWYRWTAPFTGQVVFDTCGPRTFDTLLAVYTGQTLSALQQLAANDDDCDLGSAVRVAVTEGSVYHVAVDGYAGDTGQFTLAWSRVAVLPPPANDDFASARVISGIRGRLQGTNVGATAQPGEPALLYGSSVWFRWRAPRTMPVVFSTCGAPFDTVLGVFRGTAVNALTRLAWNDDACGLSSRVTLQAQRGQLYRIGVAGLGENGPFQLRWEPSPCRVPQLRGLMLGAARRAIARAGCSVGLVTTGRSSLVPRGGVLAQWPPAGTRLAYLGRVRVVVSRGPR